ncbi:MAG TPA: 2OG-Fe(II) oxygenase [Sphingomicrobium sp.]
MTVPLAPKYLVIDDFLSEGVLAALDEHARADATAMQLTELGGAPGKAYSAMRRLWVRDGALGSLEPAFRSAMMDRFAELCSGTGIAPFEVAHVETEVVAQRAGSYFAKHVDTDTRDAGQSLATVRMISAVFYFPREPLAFSGGELVLYDFTGRTAAAQIPPRRNRLIAFPSFAYHEVTALTAGDDGFDGARWSVNCWLHRARRVDA